MTLWGECVDPSKAKLYELPVPLNQEDDEGDSVSFTTTSMSAPSSNSATKTRLKPTANLPDDHDVASGENTKPAFQTEPSDSSASSGAIGIVLIFGISAGTFFYRRSVLRRQAAGEYSAVNADDDHPMSPLGQSGRLRRSRRSRRTGKGRTKELYDAFAEHGDEEDDSGEDANEEDELVRRDGSSSSPGLRYHDEFLDDEMLEDPPVHGEEWYRDEPGEKEKSTGGNEDNRSGSGTEDGTGSWEHASTDATR